MPTDEELSRLAEKAILQEAKRGAQRAEVCGPSGWLKSKLPSTNKTFLHNTLLSAIAANRVKEREQKSRSEDGKRKRELEEQRSKMYKPLYIHASTKPKPSQSIVPTTSQNITKKGDLKEDDKNVKSEKLLVWSESGLELQNSSIHCKKPRQKRSLETGSVDIPARKKKADKSILPRNIKFVSCSDREGKRILGEQCL